MSTIALDPLDLGIAALLILANAGVSLWLRLGLERSLLTACLRAVVQLSLLGFALQWIFEQETPWIIFTMMLFMATVAGVEAVRRTSRRLHGIYVVSSSVMLVTSMLVTLFGLIAVVGVDPWYTPRYAIPILGMVLGNTLNGISVGLETALEGFVSERERVEMLLAHGATAREAARDVVRRAVRTGMIPSINMMIVAGLVSIPGMMTGQILGGEDPAQAAHYQIFILFLITSGVALGTVGIVLLATRLLFDERGRLRLDRLHTRAAA